MYDIREYIFDIILHTHGIYNKYNETIQSLEINVLFGFSFRTWWYCGSGFGGNVVFGE